MWNTALVQLLQSALKMLLSKNTIVQIVLLSDQSTCATKTLWKGDKYLRYWEYSLITGNFCHLLFYSYHFHSTCRAQWSPDFNLLVSHYNESLACKRILKRDFTILTNTCMFLLTLFQPLHWPCGTDGLFPLPKIAAAQATWSIQLLLSRRCQGASRCENHTDWLCVQERSGVSRTAWGDFACAVQSLTKLYLSTKWENLARATSPKITSTSRFLFHFIPSVLTCKQMAI